MPNFSRKIAKSTNTGHIKNYKVGVTNIAFFRDDLNSKINLNEMHEMHEHFNAFDKYILFMVIFESMVHFFDCKNAYVKNEAFTSSIKIKRS